MKKYFLTGFVILLPMAVTFAVFLFLINLFTKPFVGIVSQWMEKTGFCKNGLLFFLEEQIVQYGSRVLILLLLFAIIILLGVFTRWFLLNALINLCDKLLHKIPLINTVYKTSQDIIKTLFVSDKKSFKQVVMVPFPRENSFMIGLISRGAPVCCSDALRTELVSVLIPTTPNPTTGFLLMVKKEDLIYIDMKPEDAIKYIVSCGVILPGEKYPIT